MEHMGYENHKILESNCCYYDRYSNVYRYNQFGGYLFLISREENGDILVRDDYGNAWTFGSIVAVLHYLFTERCQPRN